MSEPKLQVEGVYQLPPLILHPFTESASTVRVLESAKASLSMLKEGAGSPEEQSQLEKQLLDGRYTEVRMLFYVGKDVFRWMDQCLETCRRFEELRDGNIAQQSFAHLLIKQTSTEVARKLQSWGVVEYARIFSRSIGIYNQFQDPPPRKLLRDEYLRYYYRHSDYAYASWKDLRKFAVLPAPQFPFTLYASGEYTKMLEKQWDDTYYE